MNLSNRTDHINCIITIHKPHIIIINELNSELNDTITRNMFPNFTLEVDNLEVVDKKARTGILIQNQIHYKCRRDLESQGTSTVWIQLSHPGRKPILILGLYRQFQILGLDQSDTIQAQTHRWELIFFKWEQAITENTEIISMGDLNLNTLRWDHPPQDKSAYENSQTPLVNSFKDKILSKGFKILKNKPTRTKDNNDSRPACLDLGITNKIEKIVKVETGIPTFSDHSMQMLVRSTKGLTTPKNT